MTVLRTDIERALDELVSNEEGMRFQGLAVVLGKRRWPDLIACERKKDFGLDAYAAATLTGERFGKGLASSITPTLKKISSDAETAKKNFSDLGSLLFVTPAKVGNTDRRNWSEAIQKERSLELHIISREDIITELMKPENASLCSSFLYLDVAAEPELADLIARTKRAAADVAASWAAKTQGYPLIDLDAVRLDRSGAESNEVFSIDSIDKALSQSRRLVLEAPAGRGKTTMLVQLARRARAGQIAFMVNLPAWATRRTEILDYLSGMPSFRAEGLSAEDLARVHTQASFLFLLNGWNEIAQSNSTQAEEALRELEYAFPTAGIIVATRTHHLTPPLPGAARLRLLRLRRAQREAYLSARLGAKAGELRALLDAQHVLDELTRTPFILAEVVSLFESGVAIPDTKAGVLAAVIRLQEEGEHRNALHGAPLFGRQQDYLQSIAAEMTRRGAVTLSDTDARAIAIAVKNDLVARKQIDDAPQQPADMLAVLTAHHLLERVDYPETAFRFEHQQFQEYYAATCVRSLLLSPRDGDGGTLHDFIVDYVNQPAWAEPLRIIAETLALATGDGEKDKRHVAAGRQLVEMALAVDVVFAAELGQFCGADVWAEVRETVGARLRALYAVRADGFRQCALAAMLATGSEEFKDIIVPLLSAADQQVRLRTYRLWPDMQVSSLGPNWRDQVRGWSDEARADFVSELLHHRLDVDVAAYAVEDNSVAVKEAAVSNLLWTGSGDAAARVLESMDPQTFADFARKNADWMPAALKPRTIAALREFIDRTTDQPARLRAALDLIELGQTDLDGVVKDALAALRGGDMRNLEPHYIRPALEYLRKTDPEWASAWVAVQVAEGVLYQPEYWMTFVTSVPDVLAEKYLRRLEAEDLTNANFGGMVAVVAAHADTELATRMFSKLRDVRRKVDGEPEVRREFEWQVMKQLEAVFRALPDDVIAGGILSSVAAAVESIDITVAADLLSRVGRSEVEPIRLADEDLKARLRAYLKRSVDVVLHQDDFNGEQKANLASSISQVGKPEDMADLVRLIQGDINRMRRGRAARAAGDRGPLGNGAIMSYAGWHIGAVMELDADGAERVLIDLLSEPEYLADAANAMARDFLPKSERTFDRTFRYDLMWVARAGQLPVPADNERRIRYAAALNAEIKCRREQGTEVKPADGLKKLANALATIDGRASAETVLDVIALPGQWDEYIRLDAAERLLMSGVVLPRSVAFALVESVVERAEKWMQESDRYLLSRFLALCAFVDNAAEGVAKIRDVIARTGLRGYQLRELVVALGESRCDTAVDLLYEIACDAQTFEQCEDNFINAFASLDTPRARELLVGFVDTDVGGIALTRPHQREDVLVTRVAELTGRAPKVAAHLMELCERDLPEPNRHILSKLMDRLGTPEALTASLTLIDDSKQQPIPRGVWDELEGAFVERRPYGENANAFTQHARASNHLRFQLFTMATEDKKRWKSAYSLLGQIEEWRLEYGRPTGEPRHPHFESGHVWPPKEPNV